MKSNDQFRPHEIRWDDQKTIQLWDFYSTSKAHQGKYFGRQSGKEVASILNRKLFNKAKLILDFSCGKGDIIQACLPYLNNGQEIYGTDISKRSVDETSMKLKDHRAFMGATLIETFPTSLASNQFDLVIFTEVIEHLDDHQLSTVLTEIHRITRPNGFVFVTTPYQEDLEAEKTMCPECGCIFHRWQHLRSWSLESLRNITTKHGFRGVECKNIQWGPFLLKTYFKLTNKPGNGIYYIGQKPRK